jgi:hypothetical protein
MSRSKLIGIIIACIAVVVVVVAIVSRPPTTYTLSVAVSPSGAGSVSPSGGQYEAGAQVTLTATPAGGHTIDHWGGSASGTASTITITMDSDKQITAYFGLETTPEFIDVSPSDVINAIYENSLTSQQRQDISKGYVGKRVRWTGKLGEIWSVSTYPGFQTVGSGTSDPDWNSSLEEGAIIASLDVGNLETGTGSFTRTSIEVHVAFNDESKPSLLNLPKGSAVIFEGTISDGVYLSGLCGELECSLSVGLRLVDGTMVGYA